MKAAISDQGDSDLIIAAFSAIMGLHLHTHVSNFDEVEKVSLFDHHKTTYSYGLVGGTPDTSTANKKYLLTIKMLDHITFDCDVEPNGNVEDIKARIHELKGIPTDQQRLIFAGKQLEDGTTMYDCRISHQSTLHLIKKVPAIKPVILDAATLDPVHNFDFTNIKDDHVTFTRGGERYIRPCGFRRYALNVSGKYENLLWIDCEDAVGEWPVSYHGTGTFENKTMAQNGYAFTQGKQYSFTHGVYSTPDIHVAEKYAKTFTYNNEQYIVVFQNRVNPANLNKLQSNRSGTGDYWVSPNDTDVRPYGICIRKVENKVGH
ncbi:unnamed protein product [Rotaria sp. Silwood2]|nr:unnamed protein product [Rotaria sp. Silwood2]CAF2867466.1 unnamed protein product [Rotaria sp. Silwood2]CAF3185432.1 unnamed protein product [Rotaria sp. Silwood2]CAF4404171.1 unnamed protein product [Rotaria sp. Silwood2]CAF4428903.1 unnamed protein product [Rotaria sp. Silwood2]